MDEFFKAIRNLTIGLILAWMGVSFSDPGEDNEPLDEPQAGIQLQS